MDEKRQAEIREQWKALDGPHHCTRCGEELNPDTMIWLELNTNTGMYAEPGGVPEAESQGCFTFGLACAQRVLKYGGMCDYKSKRTHSKRSSTSK